MRKVREILRLKFECKRSRAEIAAAACVGESTVSGYLARAEKAGLTWEVAREMTDAEIEARLFRDVGRNEPPARVPIDFSWVHRELSKPCVTLQTLWLEYREASAAQAPRKPYEYSRFCDLYAGWKRKLGVVMRQVHRAGEKVFIGYSGRKRHLVDRTTGEVIEVELFVAVLGASNYTYAEATRSQKLADWKHAKVNIDYCVCYDDRLYSVPYTLVGARVEIRATASVMELFHDGVRVASHARSYGRKGSAVIVDEHRPRAHRDYGKWPPERVVAWAETIGPNVGELARAVMRHRTHPETGYRTCLGVIRLADKYGRERVDAACTRTLHIGSPTARSVTAILRNGLDRAPLVEPPPRGALAHENIRGAEYFDKEERSDLGRDDSEAARDEAERDGGDVEREGGCAVDGAALH
ncbi:Mu transposase domain-containing protein [Sorangium sp. So ce513]|uniref:Mu transposase domain-containing protein n=1 Tax=Sorangium sp. So ce513 TaxID=3133315 RepID=UPI003F612FF2